MADHWPLALQEEAVRQGMHTVLLECVGNSHALLAVKVLQPSNQRQPAGSTAANKPQVMPSGRAKASIQHSSRRGSAVAGRQAEAGQLLFRSSSSRQSLQGEVTDAVPLVSQVVMECATNIYDAHCEFNNLGCLRLQMC